MIFWNIEKTQFKSDYKTSFVNGSIEHPYRLPKLIRCPVCRAYPGEDYVLPYVCEQTVQARFSNHTDVTREEFDEIAKDVSTAMQKQGLDPAIVKPGCRLLPAHLDISSKPEADFLWPSFNPVVSSRIRDLFKEQRIANVALAEVNLRKVGTKSAKSTPPMPSSGEPEGIINEVATTVAPKEIHYYELCIYSKSAPPPGRELLSTCSACGSKKFNWTRGKGLIMTESMWNGSEIFILETTANILITETLKYQLEKLRLTNIEFIPFPTE